MYQLNLTKERKVLLNLLSISINENAPKLDGKFFKGVELDVVKKEAISQGVHLCSFSALKFYKEYLVKDVYEDWKKYFFTSVKKNVLVGQSQATMVSVMNQGGFNYVVIKGESSASYYPDPNLRVLGDVDFLIDTDKQFEIENALVSAGYNRDKTEHISHRVFRKPQSHLEMHFSIPGMPSGEGREIVKEKLKTVLTTSQIKDGVMGKFSAPSDFHHGLIIMLHACHHNLNDGLGLRHICDWANYVNKTKDCDFWQELVEVFDKIGILKYAKVVTKLCSLYLGNFCPDWAKDGDEDLASSLLEDVFLGGNFGRKDDQRARSGQLIVKGDGKKRCAIFSLAVSLHKSIVLRYPIVKKVWIFYPFIYAYKVIKNLLQMVTGKKVSISKMAPHAKLRQELYDKLDVFKKGEE